MESQENVSFSIIYDDLYIVIKYLKRYIKSIITLKWITHQKDTNHLLDLKLEYFTISTLNDLHVNSVNVYCPYIEIVKYNRSLCPN